MDGIGGREVAMAVVLVMVFSMLLALAAPQMSLYAVGAIAVAVAALITGVWSGRFPRR